MVVIDPISNYMIGYETVFESNLSERYNSKKLHVPDNGIRLIT